YQQSKVYTGPPPSTTPRLRTSLGSIQALLLPYVEQSNKYALFKFDYDVNSDGSVDPPTVPALAKANQAARVQDVPIYLCPSDPSPQKYLTYGEPAGRISYHGSSGGTAYIRDSQAGGVFTNPFTGTNEMQGNTIASITDGTSNTALFSE